MISTIDRGGVATYGPPLFSSRLRLNRARDPNQTGLTSMWGP
jgi:hypothetical protein